MEQRSNLQQWSTKLTCYARQTNMGEGFVALLKMILLALGSGEAPLLDIVAYARYTFIGMCFAVHGKILSGYSYYMGIFLVKTMKRVLFAEMRSFDSSRHHFLLLLIALVQFPFLCMAWQCWC
ncbi:hypothetical protein NC653_037462 [Populus alba x Populus x berolinensis]|uniref:Uncharacterized protein n=1 Tax=Populus alba x Populus x berolinensis TaxID=444605 RepID=A0AAD6LH08_9ROSI|nr:hypothetical protein NC653_037462 [Populus alba x Populus x berolinensis]